MRRLTRASEAGAALWWLTAALLGLGAVLVRGRPTGSIDWQPGLAFVEPWRWWSAAWVHYSDLHLGANLLGTLLVAALGWAARVPLVMAIAWLAAWPLTHLALRVQPALLHYGGLSGVLHAGVVVIAVHLIASGHAPRRVLGIALLTGLVLKLLLERPWAGPVQHPPGWDIATAPIAHATGLVAGLVCSLAGGLLSGRAVAAAQRRAPSTRGEPGR